MTTTTHSSARHRAVPDRLDESIFESWKPLTLLALVVTPFVAVGIWSWIAILTS